MGFYSLVSLLPGFKSVRAPVQMWFVVALGLALLAAAGVEAVRARFRSSWIPAAMLLVLGADLYYWNMDHNVLSYARASFQEQYGAPEERFKAVAQPVTRDPLHRLYAPFDSPGFGPLRSPTVTIRWSWCGIRNTWKRPRAIRGCSIPCP